jgi:hypothetical protein
LPHWLDPEDWGLWCRDRAQRGKPITADAARLQIQKLDKYRSQGHAPRDVIEHCVSNSYQGLFPPQKQTQQRPAPAGKWGAAGRTIFGPSHPDSEVIDAETH